MENCQSFTDDVMVALVHKCVQQTHFALNGLVYFLMTGDLSRDNLMVESILIYKLFYIYTHTEIAYIFLS